jgi:protein LSM14
MVPLFTPPVPSHVTSLPIASQPISMTETNVTASKNLNSAANPSSTLSYHTVSQAISSTVASSSTAGLEMPAPLLASSGQLLQNAPSMLSSSQSMQTPLQMSNNIAKPADPKTRVSEPLLPDPPTRALPENNEPILPLPKQTPQKVCQHFYVCFLHGFAFMLFFRGIGSPDDLIIMIILLDFPKGIGSDPSACYIPFLQYSVREP